MRRLLHYFITSFVLALVLGTVGAAGASAAVGTQLLLNPDVETPTADGLGPMYWTSAKWSTNNDIQATQTWSTDAHRATHSLRVEITARPNDGDAKWWPQPVDVTEGAYYTLADWYKSNIPSAVSVEYWTSGQDTTKDGTWVGLSSRIAPSPGGWTHYQTGFTMPAGAVKAIFVHYIAAVGWLQTDDYAMTEQAPPAGFNRPMISLTFDDGTTSFYDNAKPGLDAKGFKTTQYIPSSFVGTYGFMTANQVSTLARGGDEIASHSVSHPKDLTTLGDAQLSAELGDSKAALESIPGVGTGAVTDIAYPFGFFDATVVAASQAAGYIAGRSIEVGYNAKADLQLSDLRVQNMTPKVTLDQFKSWVDYAKAHDYWLLIVYHRVQLDSAAPCVGASPPPGCLGDYDTTVTPFQQQLDYISSSGLGSDVMTVKQALATTFPFTAGTVSISSSRPSTNATVTATPSGFSNFVHSPLSYIYKWKVNGVAVPGASGATLDLSQVGHGNRGDSISVEAYARDQWGNDSAGATSNTVTVANTAPTKGSVAITPSSPKAGMALTATPHEFADADGDTLSYRYAWFAGGKQIAGATGATLAGSAVVAGRPIRVDVQASDGQGGVTDTASATVTPAALHVVDKVPPKVLITSPKAKTYRVGQKLLVKFSCTDTAGIASYKATLTRAGGKATKVQSGKKVKLTRTGRYTLKITAKDRNGNTTTRTFAFKVIKR